MIEDILFVDDREKNVNAARDLGIETIMFKSETGFTHAKKWISRRAPYKRMQSDKLKA